MAKVYLKLYIIRKDRARDIKSSLFLLIHFHKADTALITDSYSFL